MDPKQAQQIKAAFRRARQAQMNMQLEVAYSIYADLLKVLPEKPEVLYQLGVVSMQRQDHALAADFFERAHKQKPDEEVILWGLSDVYKALERSDAALEVNSELVKRFPKSARARKEKALILQQLGRFEESEKEFRKALKLEPMHGGYYRQFTRTTKLKPNDPLVKKMEEVMKSDRAKNVDKAGVAFSLAKVWEDNKQYDRVFPLLKTGNALLRKEFPYNLERREQEVAMVQRLAEGMDFPEPAEPGDFNPIFVTGMPRSGTTLVERILGSHSQCTAAGELTLLTQLVFAEQELLKTGKKMADISLEDWRKLGQLYESRLRRRFDLQTPYVTDKAIQTNLILGQARLALPSARFIVVRRDPRDNAVSIYKNFFAEGTHGYSNDLRDIARYIRSFERIVEFWKEKLPGQVHEIQYEDLTADPEGESRKLLEAAGLPWEDQVLEFYKSTGVVRTLSIAQVRQPISRGSVEAWRRYEKELEPFLDEWEKTAP